MFNDCLTYRIENPQEEKMYIPQEMSSNDLIRWYIGVSRVTFMNEWETHYVQRNISGAYEAVKYSGPRYPD